MNVENCKQCGCLPHFIDNTGNLTMWLYCAHCKVKAPAGNSTDEAVDAWNLMQIRPSTVRDDAFKELTAPLTWSARIHYVRARRNDVEVVMPFMTESETLVAREWMLEAIKVSRELNE